MLGRERPGSRCHPLCCGMDWLQVPETFGGIQSGAKRFPKEWAHCDSRARSGDSASGVEAAAPGRPAAGRTWAALGPRGPRPLRCGQRPGLGREPFKGGTLPRRGVATRGLRWRGLGGWHEAQGLGPAEEWMISRLRTSPTRDSWGTARTASAWLVSRWESMISANVARASAGQPAPGSSAVGREPQGEACLECCKPEFTRPAALARPSSRLAQVLRKPSRRGKAGTGGHSCGRRVERRTSGTRGKAGLQALGAPKGFPGSAVVAHQAGAAWQNRRWSAGRPTRPAASSSGGPRTAWRRGGRGPRCSRLTGAF